MFHFFLLRRFKLHSVRKVERKNDVNGSRFLLDLELERIKTKEIVVLSEYIYSFKGESKQFLRKLGCCSLVSLVKFRE